MKKTLLTLVLIFTFILSGFSQSLWNETSEQRLASSPKMDRASFPIKYKLYSLNFDALKEQLQLAPSRETASSNPSTVIISFPNVDGVMENFRVYESSVMHPDLAAKYPSIKSYTGQGIEDPTATISFSTTLFGLHAMTLSGKSKTKLIDTYTKDLNSYIVYDKQDLRAENRHSVCLINDEVSDNVTGKINSSVLATDGVFRTYRLAMACTIEYAAYHVTAAGLDAGTLTQKKAAVLAAMNVSMVRINGVYEREMSLRMQLVANNDLVIFVDSDNFSNSSAGSLINESQTVIDAAIGNANYDIGHTVSTGGGGLAQRPSVCVAGKAKGITGSPAPVGDAYDIDFVAHEMGHQFGANHTFSGDAGNCSGNRSNTTAVEPGSGTTIMAYAGICSPQDVQPHSDDYFHAVSLGEMFAHVTGAGNCVTGVANGNSAPVIPVLANYTIPKGTAFKLTSPTVTDANSDALTYCWEQNNTFNNVTSTPIATATAVTGTNFRSFNPTTSLTRYFPKFSDVLDGNLAPTWEKIPTVARTLNFALTVRDNRTPNGGQTARRDNVVTVSTFGPFNITYPSVENTSWNLGSTQTITWNVAGTTANNINTANVNILFSSDGGVTFPTVLASNTPNDGTQVVTLPNTASQNCRVLIEAVGNVFYAVSKNVNLGYSCNSLSESPNAAIADGAAANTAGATATRTLNITSAATINAMKVKFNTDHTWIGDLVIKLTHPDGTVITLWNRTCNNPQNSGINVTFADGAGAIVCASPTAGTYSPVQALSAFNGKTTLGTWTLAVQDFYNGDTGNIVSWGLDFGCTLPTENFQLENFVLYPNPNNGNFTVQFNSTSGNDIKIAVHDMRGRQIFNKSYQNTGLFNQNLQLSNLQSGVYLVNIEDGDKKEVKKIIIQ